MARIALPPKQRRMHSCKKCVAAVPLIATVILSVCRHAGAQTLTILPPDEVHVRPVGRMVVMTCRSSDASATAQNLRWYSPRPMFQLEPDQNVVKSRANMPRETNGDLSRVYAESQSDGSLVLTVTDIQSVDSGQYTCKGRVGGLDTTKHFILQTYEPLTVTAPTTQFLVSGKEQSTIKCQVGGSPSPTISWQKDGFAIASGEGHNSKYEIQATGLVVFTPDDSDKGRYTCRGVMSSVGDAAEVVINVDVYTEPKITRPPWIKSPLGFGVMNKDVLMGCTGVGYPAPEFRWTLGSSTTPGNREIGDVYFGTRFRPNKDTGDLHIIELLLDDAGHYWCEAVNAAGLARASPPVHLLVTRIPYFSWIQNSTNEPEGSQATIICQSTALPEANMTLQKWGHEQPYVEGEQLDDSRISVTQRHAPQRMEGDLEKRKEILMTIKKLNPSDMSNYTCLATNIAGTNETALELRVNFKPVFLNDTTTVYNWEGNRRNLTCRVNAWPHPQFQWIYLGSPVANNNIFKIYYGWMSSNLEISVPLLYPGRPLWGRYMCVASNQQGSSERAVDLVEAQLPDAPRNLTVLKVTATSITLGSVLPLFTGGVPLLAAEVLPQISQDGEVAVARRFQLHEIHHMEIKDLHQATRYSMRVTVRNERGSGRDASLAVSTLQASKPEPVRIISANLSSTSSSHLLIWDTPDNGGMPITKYNIEWREAKKDNQWQSTVVASTVTSFVISGLRADTVYEARVLATNSRGTSDSPEEPHYFLTAKSHGSSDTGVVIGGINPPSAILLGPFEPYHLIIMAVAGFVMVLIVIDLVCCRVKRCGLFMCIYSACGHDIGTRQHGKHDADTQVPLANRNYSKADPGMPHQATDSDFDRTKLLQTGSAKPRVPPKPALHPPVHVFAPTKEPDDWEPGETNVDDAFFDSTSFSNTAVKPSYV